MPYPAYSGTCRHAPGHQWTPGYRSVLLLEPFGTPLGVLTLGAGVAHLGDVGLGELLQHIPGNEPSVSNLHGREFPVLAELGDCDVLGSKQFSCLTSGYELFFYRQHEYY